MESIQQENQTILPRRTERKRKIKKPFTFEEKTVSKPKKRPAKPRASQKTKKPKRESCPALPALSTTLSSADDFVSEQEQTCSMFVCPHTLEQAEFYFQLGLVNHDIQGEIERKSCMIVTKPARRLGWKIRINDSYILTKPIDNSKMLTSINGPPDCKYCDTCENSVEVFSRPPFQLEVLLKKCPVVPYV